MGFALKTLVKLEEDFDNAIKVFLQREKKTSVADLTDQTRKYQIQFLESILAQLKAESTAANKSSSSSSKKVVDTTKPVFTFYGAALLIINDINSPNSLLQKNLIEVMGIDGKDKKLSDQQTASCYRELNKFLMNLFIERNISKGLPAKHSLEVVQNKHLIPLIEKSFKLENAANKTEAEGLKTSASEGGTPHYKISHGVSEDIVKRFGTFAAVMAAVNDAKTKALAEHNQASLEKLPPERYHQISLLLSIARTLNDKPNSDLLDAEKVAILTGAMFVVCAQIAESYKNAIISKNAESSITYKTLAQFLDISHSTPNHIEILVNASDRFVRFQCIDASISQSKEFKTIRTPNMLADIKNFKLVDYLNFTQDVIWDCRHKDMKNLVKGAASTSSYLGSLTSSMFGTGSSSKTTASKDDLVLGGDLDETEKPDIEGATI